MASKHRTRKYRFEHRQAAALAPFLHGTEDEFIVCPLCLRARRRQSLVGDEFAIEDAPPRQYSTTSAQRCLTCRESCNENSGGTFENRTALLNRARMRAVGAARPPERVSSSGLQLPKASPFFPSLTRAFDLARIKSEERQLELKSAYLIAFVTLGFSYILGEGLDVVRQLLLPTSDLTDLPVCAYIRAPIPERAVVIVGEPVPCVLVSHPTSHGSSKPSVAGRDEPKRHVVILPVPASPPQFYQRFAVLNGGTLRWGIREQLSWPGPSEFPTFWDQASEGHPLRARGTYSLEYEGAQAKEPPEPRLEIRLP